METTKTICGQDCCAGCARKEECGGCAETGGHPFGGACVAASCVQKGGAGALREMKEQIIGEIRALNIDGLRPSDLNLLPGAYVNLAYTLPNGTTVKLLEDNKVYLGNQIEVPGNDRCYGVVADETHLLVCTYGCGGSEPEIIVYQKRKKAEICR